jgi:hypothetical protein
MDTLFSRLEFGCGVTTQRKKQTLFVHKLLTVAAELKHIKQPSKIANMECDVAVQTAVRNFL